MCGYYRFAHIDGRIPANPAQYVRRPKVEPTEQHAMDRGELGRFLFTAEHYDRAHSALAVLLGPQAPESQRSAPTDPREQTPRPFEHPAEASRRCPPISRLQSRTQRLL